MHPRKVDSKIIGLLFILPLLFYGIGNSLVEGIFTLNHFSTESINIKIGGLLMILNSITVIVIGVLLFPILRAYQESIAFAYLTTRTIEAILLLIGVISTLALLTWNPDPLDGDSNAGAFQNYKTFAFGLNYYSYQISMLILGLGSLLFCYLMYKQQLIPKAFALWGCLGYGLLLIGSICELFGFKIGIALSIPGGLFELCFGFWLILKGFRSPD